MSYLCGMSRYVINDDVTKSVKKILKKHSKKQVSVNNECMKGTFTIKTYRKYEFREEVDILFEGEIYVKYKRPLQPLTREWFQSDILQDRGVSKIKVNKLLRRFLFDDVQTYLAYFGIRLRFVEEIKKVTWI